MLSRKDKLWIQPWEDRRFKEHRAKVQSALPVIDAHAPSARPHVAVKLKKQQLELDRASRIQRDNFTLLQRLNAIMTVNRLDNHWLKPLPNLNHKVGMYVSERDLLRRQSARSLATTTTEAGREVVGNDRCYACRLRKQERGDTMFEAPRIKLPSLRL